MSERMHQVLPGLQRFESSLSGPQQPVSSYVWQSAAGTILIDPAADLTPAALSPLELALPAHILITHLQEENAAGCPHWPDAAVHVPAGDEYLAAGAATYAEIVEPWPPPWEWETRGNYQGHLAGARNERPPQDPLELSHSLEPGASVCDCEVVATPGHGKSAVTLIASIDGVKVAFCGDLIYGNGQLWNWFDSDWDYGLSGGYKALLASLERLIELAPDVLCPTHGPEIVNAAEALERLRQRLAAIFPPPPPGPGKPPQTINFPEIDSPAAGFRVVPPGIHQWREGNCAVLLSASGHALMVDDGLCYWEPLPERGAHHRAAIAELKDKLGIERIEAVVPTHYHGDHIENIPELVEMEGTEVICLDLLADVLEYPERFNLACPLPWYGASCETVAVDRRLSSGASWQWREFELEMFHLGGQTYYHAGVSVTVAGQRVLFVGDAIGGYGAGAGTPICYNDNEPEHRGWLYSVYRMLEYQPDLLVCGHGAALQDPVPMLEAKRDRWEERMNEFRQLSPREDLRLFFDPFVH